MTPRPPADSSSSTCCGRGSSAPGQTPWSSRAATRWPRPRRWSGSSTTRSSSTWFATGETHRRRGSARPEGFVYPRTRAQGLEWWEARIRAIDAGTRAIPPERLLTVSLDEMLLLGPRRGLKHICRFTGVYVNRRMKQFFNRRMSSELANTERWRHGLSDRRAAKLERLYVEIIDRFEADGVGCTPLLRRHARAIAGRAGGARAPARLPGGRRKAGRGEDVSEPADLVFVGGTGRSGTTVISHLLDHHSRFRGVPIECRFHCNPKGLADVVGGRATPEQFVRKLRTYWWYRVRVGGRALVPAGVIGRSRVALWRAGARLRPGEPRGQGPRPPPDRRRGSGSAPRSRGSRGRFGRLVRASRELFYDLLGPAGRARRASRHWSR